MNVLEKNKQKSCVGCGNCVNICPQKALKMEWNTMGFLVPEIKNEYCKNCGLCNKVCQLNYTNKDLNNHFQQDSYIVITKNKNIYKKAASGGIFGTIALNFLNNNDNAYIVGAAYDNGEVRHIITDNIKDIEKIQNSKYVQSNLGEIFIQIKDKLNSGAKILFSGTPCQVKALKLFLQKEYDNLFFIDLICHGVPSPLYLKKDINVYGKNIDNINFRKKNLLFKSRSNFVLSIFKKGKRHSKRYIAANRDPYYNLFLKNQSFRESCYSCRFADLKRVGDITIGDCDSYMLYSNFHSNEATSTVIINSLKGKLLWEEMKKYFEYESLDINKEAIVNTQLKRAVDLPEKYNEIIKDINEQTVDFLQKKYAKPHGVKEKLVLIKQLLFPVIKK